MGMDFYWMAVGNVILSEKGRERVRADREKDTARPRIVNYFGIQNTESEIMVDKVVRLQAVMRMRLAKKRIKEQKTVVQMRDADRKRTRKLSMKKNPDTDDNMGEGSGSLNFGARATGS